MLKDIHKPSSTRAEVSTSSSQRHDEETDKSRFLEKEIGDLTGRPKLPVPDNLHKDYTKTVKPKQRWTLVHEGPLTTETEQSDESELSCKWGSGLLKSRLCFLTSKNHKQDYKQRGTTTWG